MIGEWIEITRNYFSDFSHTHFHEDRKKTMEELDIKLERLPVIDDDFRRRHIKRVINQIKAISQAIESRDARLLSDARKFIKLQLNYSRVAFIYKTFDINIYSQCVEICRRLFLEVFREYNLEDKMLIAHICYSQDTIWNRLPLLIPTTYISFNQERTTHVCLVLIGSDLIEMDDRDADKDMMRDELWDFIYERSERARTIDYYIPNGYMRLLPNRIWEDEMKKVDVEWGIPKTIEEHSKMFYNMMMKGSTHYIWRWYRYYIEGREMDGDMLVPEAIAVAMICARSVIENIKIHDEMLELYGVNVGFDIIHFLIYLSRNIDRAFRLQTSIGAYVHIRMILETERIEKKCRGSRGLAQMMLPMVHRWQIAAKILLPQKKPGVNATGN